MCQGMDRSRFYLIRHVKDSKNLDRSVSRSRKDKRPDGKSGLLHCNNSGGACGMGICHCKSPTGDAGLHG